MYCYDLYRTRILIGFTQFGPALNRQDKQKLRRLDRISWIIWSRTDRSLISRNISRYLLSPGPAMANRSWSIALRHLSNFLQCWAFGRIWGGCTSRVSILI